VIPQFVSVGSATPVSEQFLWLGVLFLLFNRVSASLLGCAGLGLLAARR